MTSHVSQYMAKVYACVTHGEGYLWGVGVVRRSREQQGRKKKERRGKERKGRERKRKEGEKEKKGREKEGEKESGISTIRTRQIKK